ncbi:MAG: ABC transporter permease subunit [Burkholderiales bacterium]|nr:ABC transporter permease subunit [Burkholderiales bacterium]
MVSAAGGRPSRAFWSAMPPLATLALFVFAWQSAVSVLEIPPYLLPSPKSVIFRLASDYRSLGYHSAATGVAAIGGLVLGSLLGWISAIVFSVSVPLRRMFYPYFIALKSVPIVVIAPLIALWLGTQITSRVTVVTLTCFFPLLVNSLRGLLGTDPALIEIAAVYRAPAWKEMLLLRLPSSLPFLFSGLKVASVLAVVSALVAEMMGAEAGLGFVLITSIYRLDTEALFCVSLLSAALGLATFWIVAECERRVFPWIAIMHNEEAILS